MSCGWYIGITEVLQSPKTAVVSSGREAAGWWSRRWNWSVVVLVAQTHEMNTNLLFSGAVSIARDGYSRVSAGKVASYAFVSPVVAVVLGA